MPKVLILIPAYNEERSLEGVVASLTSQWPNFDCLILNDCSTDSTESICRRNGYRFLSQPINLGIGCNMQAGYQYADRNGYDIAIQMDGDGQHDPSFLQRLIDPVASGKADMVIGSRFITKEGFQTSLSRRTGIRFFKFLIHVLCGQTISDATSGFRACSRELICFFSANYAQDYPEPEAVISSLRNGFKIMEVPVVMKERQSGVSSISPLKSVYYMIKVTIAMLLSVAKPRHRHRENELGESV